jgi:D-aminopeptidase
LRVFISADMEGVTGVTHPQDAKAPELEVFRLQMPHAR